jgi:serine-type D-Ala-D-Ala carboxypeptidase/endopeptidase (penicillin-binding protein 4)
MRRRTVLAGAAAWLAAPALRPVAAASAPSLATILESSGLAAETGLAVVDLASGQVLEAHQPDHDRPPGSVAKIVTALWGLDALGPDYRFRTEIRGTGPVADGNLHGDLVLAGGGDPLLDTDALGDMVRALRACGLAEVRGRFLVADGALPAVAEVDPGQPADAAYNPAISGMNLNFNRVFLAWSPGADGPDVAFSAPGARFEVPAAGFAAELVGARLPRHRIEAGQEIWTLARGGLAGSGSVWLPVRAPAAYAGAVFGGLAAGAGLVLPAAEMAAAGSGALMAVRQGPPLDAMLRDMLNYSTNLTAEIVGLRAAQAKGQEPGGVAASAAAMSDWARGRFGLRRMAFVDHSGLGGGSQVTAAELVAVLRQADPLGLPGLLRERPILAADRSPVEIGGVRVVSKTGTLDFVSALAGYMIGPRRLAFAILAADPERRARIRPEERAQPPGATAWATRARAEQQALLRRWAAIYG